MDRQLALLRLSTLFKGLDDEELQQIRAIAESQTFQPHEVIIQEGERGDRCYIVMSGQVRVSVGNAFLGYLGVGSHFGEMSLFDNTPRSATIMAIEPTTVLAIQQEPFLQMLHIPSPTSHKIQGAIIQQLIQRLRRTDDELSFLMQESLMDKAELIRCLSDKEDQGR